ncbi:MAG: peptide chain release factor 2 [Clostridia bacterium]
MMDFEQEKLDLAKIKNQLLSVGDSLDLVKLNTRLNELKQTQEKEGFWDDMKKAQVVNQEAKTIENKLLHYASLKKGYEDLDMMLDFCMEDETFATEQEILLAKKSLKRKIEQLTLETLLRGKYDANNAIITLHAGAGGTEAQDWTSMLYRMYTMYAELHKYKCEVLDKLDGEEAGIKTITFTVAGLNAYGFLKSEKGVHRLVRISPFDSNARRHTSFASVEVIPEVEMDVDVVIKAEDIRIDTYRSGGAGGQHVNKTDSAVRITHYESGIVVQCQNERSQIQNREQAMKMLTSKLIEKKERENIEKEHELKGTIKKIEWGSQIRSYVFCPYTLVKDHRTGCESSNIEAIMNGEIDVFINDYLKKA